MLKQRTLKQLVRTTGVGVHSGMKVELVLRPAAADTGIVFRRVDLPDPVLLPRPARADIRCSMVAILTSPRCSVVAMRVSVTDR